MSILKYLTRCVPNHLKPNPEITQCRRFSVPSRDQLEGSVASYYGKNKNYASLFGNNMHLGYHPHLVDPSQPVVDFQGAGAALNAHMIKLAGINSKSNVIDFGCGVGRPLFEVVEATNCKGTGIDLTPELIEVAKTEFATQNDRLQYAVGSILDLPEEIKNGPKFSHVFSIQVFCHIARFFNDIIKEAASVLDKEGILVVNDFLVGENGPTESAKRWFYQRLHFDHLISVDEYKQGLIANGFEIVTFEDCSNHSQCGYELLAEMAAKTNNMEADGVPLAKHYEETAKCFDRKELAMIVAVARKI